MTIFSDNVILALGLLVLVAALMFPKPVYRDPDEADRTHNPPDPPPADDRPDPCANSLR